jgi:hypothetical protein
MKPEDQSLGSCLTQLAVGFGGPILIGWCASHLSVGWGYFFGTGVFLLIVIRGIIILDSEASHDPHSLDSRSTDNPDYDGIA